MFLCLTGLLILLPMLTHAIERDIINNNSSNNLIKNYKVENTNRTTLAISESHNRKAILNKESRGLSGFFILGIIINIIMIVTFGWWFSKEWRRAKK